MATEGTRSTPDRRYAPAAPAAPAAAPSEPGAIAGPRRSGSTPTLPGERAALPAPPERPSPARRYVGAALVLGLALLVGLWLEERLGHGAFAAVSAAVVVVAWYGGLRPALLVSALSVVTVAWFSVPPRGALLPTLALDLLPLGILLGLSVLVSASAESLRRARREASEHAAELVEANRLLREQRAAAEVARRHLERLFDVTSALSTALTPDAVAEVVIERGILALGASAGSIALVDERARTIEILRSAGYPADAVARWRHATLDDDFPLAEAARLHEPIILAGPAEREARYPHLATLRRANGNGAMAAIPLLAGDAVIGVLGFNFPDARALDETDRQFILTLARQCSHALERARLFDAEHESRAAAEAANRAKSEFLAMMSHELRTPLNAIAGYTQLLELGIRGPVTEEQREDLARIQRSQRHLLGIINDILNYARIEAGQVRYEISPVEVHPLLEELEALVAPQLAAKSLAWELRPTRAELRVLADRDKLRQVLLNLLSNAIKFTPAGGRVTADAVDDDGRVALRVRDTGPGIEESRQAAIFEPFVQLDTSLHGTREGTGLGLAISRDLARGMGGDLTVESRPGAGATFTCTLPRAPM